MRKFYGHPHHMKNQNGFTLIELLVALSIFSFLSVAGVILLRASVDTQSAVAQRLSESAVVNRLISALTADLAQIIARPSRDENGNLRPVFDGPSNSDFTFVRAGRLDTLDTIQPELQKISYRFEGNMLQRINWPMIDGTAENEAAPMIENLSNVSIRYRTLDGLWRDDWSSQDPQSYPRAIELTLEREDEEALTMMFMVGPQGRETSSNNAPQPEELSDDEI